MIKKKFLLILRPPPPKKKIVKKKKTKNFSVPFSWLYVLCKVFKLKVDNLDEF